jgi:hypothetical protein
MKRKILCGGEDKSKKKSKVISLLRSIEEHKKMIKTLKHTFQSQRKKLEEMTDGGDDVDVSSESGASAFSDGCGVGEEDSINR